MKSTSLSIIKKALISEGSFVSIETPTMENQPDLSPFGTDSIPQNNQKSNLVLRLSRRGDLHSLPSGDNPDAPLSEFRRQTTTGAFSLFHIHLQGVKAHLGGVLACLFLWLFLAFPKSVFATNTGIFSMELWVKPTSSIASQALVGKAEEIRMFTDSSGYVGCQIKATTWQTAAAATTNALSLNTWTHVACTYDKANIKVYINGSQVATQTQTSAPDDTANVFKIGQDDSASTPYSNLTGVVDGFEFYNYARSAKQIAEDMNGSSVGAPLVGARTPLGHWKFDEGQGITANNSGNGGSALNGTLTSMASPATSTSGWTQAGKFGKGLLFDGSNDYVTVPDSSALDFTTAATISFWFKRTSGSQMVLAKFDADSNQMSYALQVHTDNKIYLDTSSNGSTNVYFASTNTYTDTGWNHLVGVYDGSAGTLKVYLNGVLVSGTITGTVPTSLFNSTTALETRYVNGGYQYTTGSMDEVKIYNYALTADEVKLDYNHGSSMVLGAAGNNSSYAQGAANQEYCVPGDSTSCAAPIGRWDFEEGNGGSVADTSGNGYAGSWNGTGTQHWTGGKYGKAGKFNGTDDYVSVPYNSSFDFGSGDFSVEFWLKMNVLPGDGYILTVNDCATGAEGWGQAIFETGSTGVLQTKAHPSDWMASAAGVITAGTWQHLAMRRSGGNLYTYVNGSQVSTTTITGALTNAGLYGVTMGARRCASPSNFINGQIDGLKIFNYARTPAQIAYDYNRGAPVGWWKFDECQGTTAHDSSGNNNNGTITIGTGAGTGHVDAVGTCTTSGTAWYNGVTGKRNSSMSFDGIDDYVSKADSGTAGVLDLTTNGSVSLWFKLAATPSGGDGTGYILLSKGRNAVGTPNGYMLSYIISSGCAGGYQLRLDTGTGAAYTSPGVCTSALTVGQWYHLVGTWDASSSKLYLNGVQKASQNSPNAPTDNADPLVIGAGQSANNSTIDSFTNGQIDDVRIFNYALTATQVKDIYNNGAINFGPSTGSP